MKNATEIGQLIREKRELEGLNKTELAARCGCSEQAITLIEAGKTEPSVMLVALRELDIKLGEL